MGISKAKLFYIWEILKDTDVDHPLTAAQIGKLLDSRYGIDAERKSICRDVNVLRDDCGLDINLSEDRKSGYYMASRKFEDWELKFLIDAVMAYDGLAEKDARKLVEKLKSESSQSGRELLSAITPVSKKNTADRRRIKYGIDTVLKAIRANCQISFNYFTLDVDKEPKLRRERKYIVSPYALVRKDGFYYLVCNYSKYDNLSFYRLERMGNINLLETEPRRPLTDFFGRHERSGLSNFVQRNIYSFIGEPIELKLEFPNYEISDIIDSFGDDADLRRINEEKCEARIKVQDGEGLYFWLLQRAENVKVISPVEVKEKLVGKLKDIVKMYEG